VITVPSVAQRYFPFPTDNASWNIHFESGDQHSSPDTMLLRYTLGEDSIVNSVSYIKLIEEWGDTVNPSQRVIGLLTEIEKKIYYRGSGMLSAMDYDSILLYDFTKEIGDTIIHSNTDNFHSIILDIDSVIVGTEYRKRYQVNCSRNIIHSPTDYWIEGIGSILNGPIGFITGVPTSYVFWELVCYHDQSVEYVNPRFESCYPDYFFTRIENPSFIESSVEVYPNPCANTLHFNVAGKPIVSEYTVTVYDIIGNLILMRKTEGNFIDVEQLGPGMYILDIDTGSDHYKHKFLKADFE